MTAYAIVDPRGRVSIREDGDLIVRTSRPVGLNSETLADWVARRGFIVTGKADSTPEATTYHVERVTK